MRQFLLILLFQIQVFAGEQKICSVKDQIKEKIETCLRTIEKNHCEDFSSDQRINCYEPSELIEINYAKECAAGGIKGVQETIQAAKKLFDQATLAVNDNSTFLKEVRKNAAELCQAKREVKEAKEYANQVISNIGRDAPNSAIALNKANQVYLNCVNEEVKKGDHLGIALSLPQYSEIKEMVDCLKPAAKVETLCSIVLPMAAGGVAASVVKSAVKKAIDIRSLKLTEKISKVSEDYLKELSAKKITQSEFYSLRHQQDLVSMMANPETNRLLTGMSIDIKALANGMLDSDLGKLSSFKKILTESSESSNQLFNVLKGSDQATPAGKAFSEFMQESNMSSKGLFNQALTNDEIREVIKSKPVLFGFMHEAPGISEAIEQLNKGLISSQQFKARLGANLFHNGPQAGFWDQLTEKFVSDNLKSANEKKFFKNTVFEGKTTADGVVRAKYPSPVSKEGLVHTMADRLSQGTAGGNIKIFNELAGAKFAENVSVKIGEMPNPFGAGTTNGMNMFRDLLEGNPLSKPMIKSNPEMTLEQLSALEKHASSARFLSDRERENFLALLKSAQNRMKAFKDFMKPPQFEAIKDASGNVEKIILKGPTETGAQYIATIDKNTPANEALAKLEKFFKKEELVNGDPLKDLMKPRKLSPTELIDKKIFATGAGVSGALHFYCSDESYKILNSTRTSSPMKYQTSPGQSSQ